MIDADSTPIDSPIVRHLTKRERKLHTVDASSVLDREAPGALFVRTPTMEEEQKAMVWAARHRAREVGDAESLELKSGVTLETAHLLASCYVNTDGSAAFGHPLWMIDRLTGDEFLRLLDRLNEARASESRRVLVDETVAAEIVTALSAMTAEDAPMVVAQFTRSDLIETLRLASVSLMGGQSEEEAIETVVVEEL